LLSLWNVEALGALPRGNGIWLANNALWFFAKRAIALKLVYPHIMLIIMMTRVGVC
jgi:hypothetical protein